MTAEMLDLSQILFLSGDELKRHTAPGVRTSSNDDESVEVHGFLNYPIL